MSVRWSVTEVMMLVEPTQKNVAMIASPTCGFCGLNPLLKHGLVPSHNAGFDEFSLSESFHWSRSNPGAPGAPSANRGGTRVVRSGLTGLMQLASSNVAATSAGQLTRVIRLSIDDSFCTSQGQALGQWQTHGLN